LNFKDISSKDLENEFTNIAIELKETVEYA